jgi:2-dehydropantoate 2-reductase
MRIAIMGSGSIGGLVGGRLASTGAEVLFLARGAHLRAMQASGLRILSEAGDLSLPRVDATDDPEGREPVDFVIFTVKGPDTEAAAALIAPLVGPDTGIVSFQNGIEGVDILAARYGSEAVLPGTTMIASVIEAPGVIRHVSSAGPFTVGEWNGQRTERLDALRDIAAKAGLDLKISDDAHVAIWSKFVAMGSMSAITCLTRLPLRTLASIPETRELALEAMGEVIAVAKARGVTVPHDVPSNLLAAVKNIDPTWKTSMCNDLEAGKVIEVVSLSGSLHRLGRELGVPTPVHSVAYRALKPYAMPRT